MMIGKSMRQRLPLLAAYAAIYLIWGTSYLAIRVALEQFPPFLLAGVRFALAGLILLAITRMQGLPFPTAREWKNASLLGAVLFLGSYSALFWSETRVASGLAAVLYATMQLWVLLIEVVVERSQRFHWRMIAGSTAGLAGVAIISWNEATTGRSDLVGVVLVLVAAVLWAIGAAWTKHLTLPEGKSVSAAAQMLTGGAMMLVPAFVLGDLRRVDWGQLKLLPVASFAYLVVFASLLAFTSYVWLIHREPVSKVASYAYVNPVIAVVVGYFLGSEPLTWKTAMGSALVLVAVFAVTSRSTEERTSELEAPAEEISKLELAEVVHPKAE